MREGHIRFARRGPVVLLKLSGSVTFLRGSDLEAFIRRIFAEGRALDLVVDLHEAEHLDSTILGLLARTARYQAKCGGQPPCLLSSSDDINLLLDTMGFSGVFAMRTTPAADLGPLAEIAPAPHTGSERARTVLDAHRALLDLGPRREADAAALRDVVDMLRQEVGPLPDGEAPSEDPPPRD